MVNKKKRFWFHYNKPESKKQDCNILTVHWNNMCVLVHSIQCSVATESHDQKSQPHCIIRGWCDDVSFVNKDGKTTAVIV